MASTVVDATSSLDYSNPPDGIDLTKWTVSQLKLFLRPRGSRLTGRRHELLALAQLYYGDDELRGRRSQRPARGRPSTTARAATTQTANDDGESGETGRQPSKPPRDFPEDGWSRDAKNLPNVSIGVILHHLERRERAGGLAQPSEKTQKPLNRGYNFFFWSYVHGAEVSTPNAAAPLIFVRARCHASQQKRVSYQQQVILTPSPGIHDVEVMWAHCSCPAGIGGGCQHVVAVLFTINAAKAKGEKLGPLESCTSLARAWGPRQRNIAPQPVQDVVVERASFKQKSGDNSDVSTAAKKVKKGPAVESTLFEARAGAAKVTTLESLLNLRTALEGNANTKRCGLVQVLQGYDLVRHAMHDTKFGIAPFGSCQVYQQRGDNQIRLPASWQFGDKVLVDTSASGCSDKVASKERSEETIALYEKRRREGYNLPRTHCPDYYQWLDEQDKGRPQQNTNPDPANTDQEFIQVPLYEGRVPSDVAATQPVSADTAWRVERRTRDQSNSAAWHSERSSRITASRFHEIVRRKKRVDVAFLQRIFSQDAVNANLAPLSHGRASEDLAARDYVETMAKIGKTVKVFHVGLCLHPDHGYIGASPDGLVWDSTSELSHGLLEIKCPLSLYEKDLTPEEAAASPDFFCTLDAGQVTLRATHKYHTQVQGQLGVSGLKWCDFVVWCGPGRLSIQRIHFDAVEWNNSTLPSLVDFYTEHGKVFLSNRSA